MNTDTKRVTDRSMIISTFMEGSRLVDEQNKKKENRLLLLQICSDVSMRNGTINERKTLSQHTINI